MTRRCSHCSHNGHNSRTCPNRGVKLFGVRLIDGSIRKSASMGNLSHYAGSSSNSGNATESPLEGHDTGTPADGYASEDFVQGSSSSCRERKKGIPWTEEEHRMFLLGLQKLGKGDWRGISRNFVLSRTPTQVASHAQKYFIRQSNLTRRKRRSSLFDIVPDEPVDVSSIGSHDILLGGHQHLDSHGVPTLGIQEEECDSMDSGPLIEEENSHAKAEQISYPVAFSTYFSPIIPFPFPLWPSYTVGTFGTQTNETHEIVRPTAVHSKSPINIEELVGISKLSLKESTDSVGPGKVSPSSLSLKLQERAPRQSAFHANPTSSSSQMGSGNPIHAL